MGKNIDEEDKVLKKLLGGQSALDQYYVRMKEIWDKVVLDKKGIHVNVARIEKEEIVEPYEDDGKPLPEEEVREFMRYLGIADGKYNVGETIKYWSGWIKRLKAEGKYGGKVTVGKLKELKEDGYTKIKARGLKEIEVLNRVFGSRDATSEEIYCMSKRGFVQKLHKLLDQDKITEAEEYLREVIKGAKGFEIIEEICSDFVLIIKNFDGKYKVEVENTKDERIRQERGRRNFVASTGIGGASDMCLFDFIPDKEISDWEERQEEADAKNKIRGKRITEIFNKVFKGRELTKLEINRIDKGEDAGKVIRLVDQGKLDEAGKYLKEKIEEISKENEAKLCMGEERSRSHIYQLATSPWNKIKIEEIDNILGNEGRKELFKLLDEGKQDEGVNYVRERVKGDKDEKDAQSKVKGRVRIDFSVLEALLYFVGAGVFAGVCLYLVYQLCRAAYVISKAIVG